MNEEQKEKERLEQEKAKVQIKLKGSQKKSNPPGIGTWVGYNFYDLR